MIGLIWILSILYGVGYVVIDYMCLLKGYWENGYVILRTYTGVDVVSLAVI